MASEYLGTQQYVAELTARARDGDKDAFDALVERFGSRLIGCIMKYLRDPDVGNDVMQKVLVDAWQKREQLRDPAALVGWVCTIARRKVVDEKRCEKGKPQSLDLLGDSDTLPVDESFGQGSPVEEAEDLAMIGEQLDETAKLLPSEPAKMLRSLMKHAQMANDAKDLTGMARNDLTSNGMTDGAFNVGLHRLRQRVPGAMESTVRPSFRRRIDDLWQSLFETAKLDVLHREARTAAESWLAHAAGCLHIENRLIPESRYMESSYRVQLRFGLASFASYQSRVEAAYKFTSSHWNDPSLERGIALWDQVSVLFYQALMEDRLPSIRSVVVENYCKAGTMMVGAGHVPEFVTILLAQAANMNGFRESESARQLIDAGICLCEKFQAPLVHYLRGVANRRVDSTSWHRIIGQLSGTHFYWPHLTRGISHGLGAFS